MTGLIRSARRPPGFQVRGPPPAGDRGEAELLPADDEDLCFLVGDWRIFQKQRGHRWSLDDLVTAWVAARQGEALEARRALDLGCGLGSVLLMLAWRLPELDVTGLEAQLDRAAMGRRSIRYDGAEARCRILDGDLRDAGVLPATARFELITGTPPYFPRGTGTESALPHAMPCRFEARGGVEDYLAAAARWLTETGRVVLCSAALEAGRIAPAAKAVGLCVREHLTVVPRAGKAPLVMVDVFARQPGPRVDEVLTVRDAEGQWTAPFRALREEMGMPTAPPSASREGPVTAARADR
ncbi:MAG: SAM-dependent methyltransferase [Myxococcota bacterium]